MSDPARAAGNARPHVLIVSDDPDLATFLGEGLLYAGFWTSTVASALQALEVFRLRSFDLVLVDAALAGLGGFELVRRLRGHGRGGGAAESGVTVAARTDVPLLMIAGAAGAIGEGEAHDAGADGVLEPPLDLEELAPRLFAEVLDWRMAHPGRAWADAPPPRRTNIPGGP